MTKAIENLFVFMSAASDILIVLIFLINTKNVKNEKALWAIFIYCASSLISNYIGDNVLPVQARYVFYTFFTLIEYLIFSSFLFISIKNQGFKKLIIVVSILFTMFVVVYLSLAKHQKIDSLSIGIETILIILYSFYYMYEQMNNTSTLFIYSKFEFWIITGFLIYLAGSFFIYIFANQVDQKFIINYWFLTNVFYIIKNVFFAIGIFTYVKKHKKTALSAQKYHPFLS